MVWYLYAIKEFDWLIYKEAFLQITIKNIYSNMVSPFSVAAIVALNTITNTTAFVLPPKNSISTSAVKPLHLDAQEDASHNIDWLLDLYETDPDLNGPLQNLVTSYDNVNSYDRLRIMETFDEKLMQLAEQIAVLKSVQLHLQRGHECLLEDEEVDSIKSDVLELMSRVSVSDTFHEGDEVDMYLDGEEVDLLQDEIMDTLDTEAEDKYLDDMKTEWDNLNPFDAWNRSE